MKRLAAILATVTPPSAAEWEAALQRTPLRLHPLTGTEAPLNTTWRPEFPTVQAAWEALASRDLLPMAWMHDARVFLCPMCRGERGRVCHFAAQVGGDLFPDRVRTRELPFPWSFADLVSFAYIPPETVLRAEELARGLMRTVRRYRPVPDRLAWVSRLGPATNLLDGPPVDEWHVALQAAPESEALRGLPIEFSIERLDARRFVLAYPRFRDR